MASESARLASSSGLLAMASWVARLASALGYSLWRVGLLASRATRVCSLWRVGLLASRAMSRVLALAIWSARRGELSQNKYGFSVFLTQSFNSHHVKPLNYLKHQYNN